MTTATAKKRLPTLAAMRRRYKIIKADHIRGCYAVIDKQNGERIPKHPNAWFVKKDAKAVIDNRIAAAKVECVKCRSAISPTDLSDLTAGNCRECGGDNEERRRKAEIDNLKMKAIERALVGGIAQTFAAQAKGEL